MTTKAEHDEARSERAVGNGGGICLQLGQINGKFDTKPPSWSRAGRGWRRVHHPMLGGTPRSDGSFTTAWRPHRIGYFPNLARFVEACANVHARARIV